VIKNAKDSNERREFVRGEVADFEVLPRLRRSGLGWTPLALDDAAPIQRKNGDTEDGHDISCPYGV